MKRHTPLPLAAALLLAAAPLCSSAQEAKQEEAKKDAAGHMTPAEMQYQAAGSPLMSGYLAGEKYMNGKAAALAMPLDRGRVVLVGFRPQWRGQPFGTFRVIFNAVLNVGR